MTKQEYLSGLGKQPIDQGRVEAIQKKYGAKLPSAVQRVISNTNGPLFFDDGGRVLAYEELLDAESTLHVDFTASGIVPLVDCYDNDFIVYHISGDYYSMFNIVDKCQFMERESLEELLR